MLDLPIELNPVRRDCTVALCHGCFDVIHFGHINHLEAAAGLADRLVVSITDDAYITKPGRPVFSGPERRRVLEALHFVDWVFIIPAKDAVSTIRALRPEVFVKGSDYRQRVQSEPLAAQFAMESDAVRASGGTVVFTTEQTFSSTATLRRLARASGAPFPGQMSA